MLLPLTAILVAFSDFRFAGSSTSSPKNWPGEKHNDRRQEKETRQTEKEVGRQHQAMDRSGFRQVPEGNGEEGKMEETGCEVIYGAPNDPQWFKDRRR